MKCPECIKENKKSNVHIGYGTRTLMCVDRYYDENGLYHIHDLNDHSQNYYCSNGHNWFENTIRECPSCDFNKVRK